MYRMHVKISERYHDLSFHILSLDRNIRFKGILDKLFGVINEVQNRESGAIHDLV